ncbi:hypothetical protein SDC9_171880 [bioreactor metagenome]|uniref:Right handed beta helix domain-containing protein n=1 Tax=bioreactor metagenome TaxID=1076179 RepID=A0A645GC49_9ZZZZ
MFKTHNNVRITGLVLQGSDAATHEGEESYVSTLGIIAQGAGVEIDNCEISGFNGAAISATVGDIYIHHCYIHHCRGENQGAGIQITKAAVRAEYNLFSNCRNAIKLSGAPAGSLVAENNVEAGNSLEEVICIKSGSISSALDSSVKQTASTVVIRNNTILGKSLPYTISSIPENELTVENNIFSLPEASYPTGLLYGTSELMQTLKPYYTIRSNVFDILSPAAYTYCTADPGARPAAGAESDKG